MNNELIGATIRVWWKLALAEIVLYFTLLSLAILVRNRTGIAPFIIGLTYSYGGSVSLFLLPLALAAAPGILCWKAESKKIFLTIGLSITGIIAGILLVSIVTGLNQRISDAVQKLP